MKIEKKEIYFPRKREIIFASKDERKIIMVFLHNRANEDDDKDSHTIYSYVCMLCIFAFNGKCMLGNQATTINIL